MTDVDSMIKAGLEGSKLALDERGFDEAFPLVDPGVLPCGDRVIVQLRRAAVTKGSIIKVQETISHEKYHEHVAIVKSMGPLAYRDVNTLEWWPEGAWCKEGDIVRVAKYGGDRWSIKLEDGVVNFILLEPKSVLGIIKDWETARLQFDFYS